MIRDLGDSYPPTPVGGPIEAVASGAWRARSRPAYPPTPVGGPIEARQPMRLGVTARLSADSGRRPH